MKSRSPLFIKIEPLDSVQKRYRWLLELAWITLAIAATVILIYPYLPELSGHSFFVPVLTSLLTTGILGRYVLNLKITPWSGKILTLLLLGLFCIPLGIYLFMEFTEFQVYYDDLGFEGLFEGRSYSESSDLKKGLRRLSVFAFVGGLISVVLLPFSIAIYLWRLYKRSER